MESFYQRRTRRGRLSAHSGVVAELGQYYELQEQIKPDYPDQNYDLVHLFSFERGFLNYFELAHAVADISVSSPASVQAFVPPVTL